MANIRVIFGKKSKASIGTMLKKAVRKTKKDSRNPTVF
jgi:hypothetical protein